ncbi:MAG: YIP1 family protein [Pseudomonadota bacterium]
MTTIAANFATFMARGYLAQRATVRGLLDEGHGFKVAMLFIALGYLLEAILVKLLVSSSATADVPLISFHLLNGIATVCGFLILSGLVFWAGRAMGGVATLAQSQLAVSWFMLTSSLLTPFAMASLPDQLRNPPQDPNIPLDLSDTNPFPMFLVAGAVLWLLSSTVAEVHGFSSVWKVAGVILAIPIGIILLLSMLGGA